MIRKHYLDQNHRREDIFWHHALRLSKVNGLDIVREACDRNLLTYLHAKQFDFDGEANTQ
jgi:hypothetical protein